MQDDDTHDSVSRVYETVLIIIYTHIYLSLSPPQPTKYTLNRLYFIPKGLGAMKMSAGTEKAREPCMCDVIIY